MAGSKNIVICSDGTGNTAIKGRGTNVFKIFEAVDICGHWKNAALRPQVAIYDDGVGTQGFTPLRLLSGAFGWGLSRNIRRLYTELARCYEPGDSIYLFGFSRGAFTVRSLAGFIGSCGILDARKVSDDQLEALVAEAYRTYRMTYRDVRKGSQGTKRYQERAEIFRRQHGVVHDKHAPEGKVDIAFIGVWDTVDAVGLPFDELTVLLNSIFRFKFPDHVLRNHVQRACHALSIDDERRTFHPLMWDERNEKANGWTARIEQVWFPGAHSNVGGGYPKQGMSLVSLYWMMRKAEAAGARFVDCDWKLYYDHQNPFDKLYDSRAGLGAYYRYLPRDIGKMCRDNGTIPKIHLSSIERVIQGSGGYTPGNIPAGCQFVATETPPKNLPDIGPEITTALGSRGSLLDDVRPWVYLRHYSNLIFLVVSLAALALIFRDSRTQPGCSDIFCDPFSVSGLLKLAKCLMLNPTLYITLLCVIAFFYLLGWVARRPMERAFSGFWHALHARLSGKLYP